MGDLSAVLFTSVCMNAWHDLPMCAGKLAQSLQRNDGILPDILLHTAWLATDAFTATDVCIFYTFGLAMTSAEQEALLRYVHDGKGFVGLHTATCAVEENQPYLEMVGGRFRSHPPYGEFAVQIADRTHPITEGVPDFLITDELYLTDQLSDFHMLATASHEGQKVAIAWTRAYGAGRVAYISLGHSLESFNNPHFFELTRRAVKWAAGRL